MPAAAKRGRVLVVDGHPIVRRGLVQTLERAAGLQFCGAAGNALEALEAIARLQPDVVVAGLPVRGASGVGLIEKVAVRHPGLPVLVFSTCDEALYAERALQAGASGYLMKTAEADEVMTALRMVLHGEIYLSESMASRMMHRLVGDPQDPRGSPLERLSSRELEVFEFIGRGLGTREIAETLHVSVKTVETHRAHIKEKLALRNALELLQHAIHWAHNQGIS